MVERISKIQQLLAESKFVEAQKEAEIILGESRSSESIELLELYFLSLKSQSRPLPSELVFSLIDKLLPSRPDEAQEWLRSINQDQTLSKQRTVLTQIRISEIKGKTEELYQCISQYQILRYEANIPNTPHLVNELSEKYFPNDFHLQLQNLALDLKRMDLDKSEKLTRELILSCFEKSSPKGTVDKLNSIYQVLARIENSGLLELYRNFCFLMVNKVQDKKDYKKLVEFVIAFEDFKMQILVLSLFVKQGMNEIAKEYSREIRKNKQYSYIYLDKYFPDLKLFFVQRQIVENKVAGSLLTEADLVLDRKTTDYFEEVSLADVSDEDALLAHLLKHQDFSTSELLDVAVSFIQSEFYLAALTASELAFHSTDVGELKLRASYMKVVCLLKKGDYRSALDTSLEALNFSVTQNDILSFLYSQAESHLRLKEYNPAKAVLRKILSIDSNYRQAKERLERLNAI
jgi:hypothetical protein